ncbi:MAG TPA: hypothetical protein VI653_01210 [Steroidobacteraceae bacterium]
MNRTAIGAPAGCAAPGHGGHRLLGAVGQWFNNPVYGFDVAFNVINQVPPVKLRAVLKKFAGVLRSERQRFSSRREAVESAAGGGILEE